MPRHDVTAWLGDGIIVAGLALAVSFLVRAFRHGAVRLRRSSPLDRLAPEERRRALRQIRGQVPVEAPDAAALRPVAEQLAAQRPLLGLAAGLILVEAGQALLRLSVAWTVASVVLAVLIAAAAALVHRDVRRARRFLRHGAA